MSPQDILAAVAAILTERGHRAALRHRLFEMNGSTAAILIQVRGDWRIRIQRVESRRGVELPEHLCRKSETAGDIAHALVARQLIMDAVEYARREALTPEQREAEDRVCTTCAMRDPGPDANTCGHCRKAA